MCTLDDFQEKKELFQDGKYTVWSTKADEIKPGDIVYLTTSVFEYDCVYGVFMRDIHKCAVVEVEILQEDLSEYVPGKSSNGGCYGFASARVVEVLETGY